MFHHAPARLTKPLQKQRSCVCKHFFSGVFLSNFVCFQNKQTIRNTTTTLIDDVAASLLTYMVVDQEPEELKTNALDMVLNRLSPSSLDINTDIKGVNAVFKVPYGAIATDPKANDTNFIDALVRLNNTVLFFTNYPY